MRFGSIVSSPEAGSPITECTTTSVPSSSTPAASQPRIIGSRPADSPTPRSDHRSWWLSELARTSTVAQSSGVAGGSSSPTTRPASGSSELIDAAYAARTSGQPRPG